MSRLVEARHEGGQAIQLFDHPGDAFAQLFDLLDQETFQSRMVEDWLFDPSLRRESDAIRQYVLEHGAASGLPTRQLTRDDQRGIFTALLGIAEALEYVSPFCRGSAKHNLHWLARDYGDTNRLNTPSVPGAVIFRASFPSVPLNSPRPETLFSVLRVREEQFESVERIRLPEASDVTIPYGPDGPEPLTIGCVPMAEPGEVRFVAVPGSGDRPGYRLECEEKQLLSKIPEIVRCLDKERVEIAVIPEGCLTDALLECWQQTLKDTEQPYASRLAWIVVGTGPVKSAPGSKKPTNSAVVLARDGRELWTQDKACDFSITESQARSWELELGAQFPCKEDIRLAEKRWIIESRIGRVSILICEDLSNTTGAELRGPGAQICAWGVSHLLVPVVSGGLRWCIDRADSLCKACGTSVVVSNSRSVRIKPDDRNATSFHHTPPSDRLDWPRPAPLVDAHNALEVQKHPVPVGTSFTWTDYDDASSVNVHSKGGV